MIGRLGDWLVDMPRWRFVLLVIASFVVAAAWSWSLGTSQPPETPQRWSPQTQASAVPTEVGE